MVLNAPMTNTCKRPTTRSCCSSAMRLPGRKTRTREESSRRDCPSSLGRRIFLASGWLRRHSPVASSCWTSTTLTILSNSTVSRLPVGRRNLVLCTSERLPVPTGCGLWPNACPRCIRWRSARNGLPRTSRSSMTGYARTLPVARSLSTIATPTIWTQKSYGMRSLRKEPCMQ